MNRDVTTQRVPDYSSGQEVFLTVPGTIRPMSKANRWTPDDWLRVAEAVSARRAELDISQEELASSADRGLDTVWRLEKGAFTSRRTTLRGVARALGWTPGSLEAILNGGDPELAPAVATPPPREALERELGDELIEAADTLGALSVALRNRGLAMRAPQ